MNAALRRPAARMLVEGASPDVLGSLRQAGVAAAVWTRALAGPVADALDAHDADRLVPFRARLDLGDVGPAVALWLAATGLDEGPAGGFLSEDVPGLARRFAGLVGARAVGLRLDVLRDDACARFHVDNVRARLLCTYRGPGTEYADLAAAAAGPEGRLARGAVAVFRGLRWEGAAVGLLHRSPPIDGTGATRLLLAIDAADAGCACC